ncbi:related to protein MCH2 (monocarboxylate permease homolog) [Cephalotrichum gorgonifer]|uniref:Related to protein MCH2 (Monocarboxylate permease homolog) n=1 Tax=Cephalotrichum gorgonifer TaxID=2041049 RepID=A0AAE8N1A4_9PEZI|nr:related to protein MCH2 (monocarboxylate permease homolog) [Cephalotrichum gorgonifer]
MSATTTAVELTTRLRPHQPSPSGAPGGGDAVLDASRLADSTVPDGGHGWVVVAGCAVVVWWAIGTTYSWGVMQEALVAGGLSTPAVLSFIGGLDAALISALAVANSKFIRSVGTRRAGMLGVALMGGQRGAERSEQNICFMIVTVIPAQYFSAKRGLANGLVFAGGGFGGAAISVSLDALIQRLDVAWAYRILGLTTLATGLPAAWLIKERNRSVEAAPGFVEWSLFKSPTFTLIFLASAIGTFPLFVPPFFLPLYANQLGLSSSAGALIVAGFSLASAAGRILCGILCDRLGALNTLFLSMVLTALSMLAIWPASTSLAPLALFVVVNGVANGGFFSTMPTVVGNVFGSARVAVAMSMIVSGWAGGYLMGAPIAGYLLKAHGGAEGGLKAFRPAMFYAGSLAAGAAVLVAIVRLRMNRSLLGRL